MEKAQGYGEMNRERLIGLIGGFIFGFICGVMIAILILTNSN